MSHSPRRQVATLISLLALSGLVACGDNEPGDGPAAGGSPSADGLTTPGSALRVGETATVTRDGAGEVLEVTITRIDEGSSSDLAGLGRPASARQTPFFVHYELRHVSGDSPYLPIHHFLSAWAGDTQLDGLAIFEPFPLCQEETFRADVAAGTTVEGCATYLSGKGEAPLDRLQLSYGDDYDAFDGHQITWER
ncbi:hypothetical protein LRP67_19640 [Nocardioides sp. cx-169]|uniref:hypothetical protein n=1 Tax=Nocardioides sp. cx-169 TaxID=2899080 RepID=UPI001E580F39|nr:hypothetical protein [Nocardioides sp. cx-169]MCD4536310.1 hypothetical protein [Nocardioides sp. cx-169]